MASSPRRLTMLMNVQSDSPSMMAPCTKNGLRSSGCDARRTGAERGFATAKDPASNDIARGWCRLMGLTRLMLFTSRCWPPATAHPHRLGRPAGRKPAPRRQRAAPETRRRRRKTLTALTSAAPP